ncbi:uncharacterized protein [Misgurnus anguillicaudatus]|uniref:uncharacterized protein n=1 Tax=Misgurnus anguillicaudatus TaxID=75329 RepID=UPI0024360BFF|nr:PWWP domain-containing DNA repair factor 3A [Misgurnus anguillicaudatus]XP_055057617.1 PWWP domain-containing DNA repair factor 3A [Misgurnus anguillicaudatus]
MNSHGRKNPRRTRQPIPEVLPKSHTPGSCDNASTLHSRKTRKTPDLHAAGSCGLTETVNDKQKPQALNQSACPDPSNRLQKPSRPVRHTNGHVSSNSGEPEPKKSTFQKHPTKISKTSRKGKTKADVQPCDKGDVATPSDVAGNKPCFDRLKNDTELKAKDNSDKTKRTRTQSSKKIQKCQTSSDVSKGLHKRTTLSPRSQKQKSSSHTNKACSSGPCTPKRGNLKPCPLLSSTPNSRLRSPNPDSEISCSPCTPRSQRNITQCSPVQVSSPDDKPVRKVKPRKLTAAGKPEGQRKRNSQEPRSSRPSKRCKKSEMFLTESPQDETSLSSRFSLITPNPELQQKLDESMSSDLSIELSLQGEFQPLCHSLSIQEDEEDQDNDDEEELPSFLQQDNKKPSSISEGLCVWCKLRKYPYWPAVVKSVNHKSKKASIVFIDGYITDQKRKRKGFFVSLRTLKPFDCEESEKLVDAAKEKYGSAITWSLELISDYRIRIGCGSFTGSLIEYCAADISCPVRRKFSEGKSVLTFPSQEILSEQFHSSDDNTEDIAVEEQDDLHSKKVLPDRARAARNRANEKLVDFIVNRRRVENHLLAVIGGQESSQWMQAVKKSTRRVVDVYLEDEEQVDKVYRYLDMVCNSSPQINNCLEKIQADRIKLILDVLLPEAIIRAIAGVHRLSLVKAEEKYRSGPCFSKRERQEFDMIIEQQMKLKEIALQHKKNYD